MNERCRAFDRPALILPAQMGGQDVVLAQQVGFLNKLGIEYQISVERALQLGLLAQGEVRVVTMLSEDWRHSWKAKRADEACKDCPNTCNAREEAKMISDARVGIFV